MQSVNLPIYGRIPIGNKIGVGDVVGILIKTAARLKAKYRKNDPRLGIGKHENYDQRVWYYDIIPVTAKLEESYYYDAEVTNFPTEAGALVADHVIIRPLRIEFNFEVTNIDFDGGRRFSDARDAWEQAKKRLESREPVQIMLAHAMLDNMVCTSIRANTSAPMWGKLSFRLTFQQVQQLALQTVKITNSQVTAADKTATEAINGQAAGTSNLSAVGAGGLVKNVAKAIQGASASGITRSFMAKIF